MSESSLSHHHLARLNKFASESMVSAADTIDWHLEPRRPDWLSASDFAVLLGQLLRGEALAADVCSKIKGEVSGALRESFRMQEEDERRHIYFLNRYMDRLGCAAGPSRIADVFSQTLSWHGNPAALILVNNVVLEAEALTLYKAVGFALDCPLFRAIATRIGKDEARHVRLGQLIIDDMVKNVPHNERNEIFVWIRTMWHRAAEAALNDYSGALRAACGMADTGFLKARWASHEAALAQCGFLPSKVMASL